MKRCLKLAVVCFLCAVGFAGSSNAAWPQPTGVVSPETAVLEAACRASGLVFWSPDTPHLYDVVVTLMSLR